MCKIMEDILKEENVKRIVKMLNKGYSKEEILELDYTEEEYREAEKELVANSIIESV